MWIGVDNPPTHLTNRRIFLEMRAGGAQQADARRMITLPDTETRNEIYTLIHLALSRDMKVFDIVEQIKMEREGLASEENTPMLQLAWNCISNAWGGEWDKAPAQWQEKANLFRDAYFNQLEPED
jgi:hypothetical protein